MSVFTGFCTNYERGIPMTHDDWNLEVLESDLHSLAARQERDEQFRLILRERLLPEPRRGRHRRPALRFALPAGAAAAALAATVIVVLAGGGTGGPGTASAAILHRTLAAVTPPSGTILHVKTVDRTDGTEFVGEWWQQTSPPYAGRGIKGPAGHLGEFADDGTKSYAYDPATNTIYERPDTGRPSFGDPVTMIRQQLADGEARVSGPTVIAGQPLYAIRLSNGITAYVDAGSYVPRYVDDPQRDGTTVRFQVVAYDYLAATPENLSLLSMTAQHPQATVDSNPGDWPAGAAK